MMATDPPDEQEDAYQKRFSRLLAVLQEKPGQWMNRREITDALGITTFSGSFIIGMEALESLGLIEIRRVVRRRWEYRSKPEVVNVKSSRKSKDSKMTRFRNPNTINEMDLPVIVFTDPETKTDYVIDVHKLIASGRLFVQSQNGDTLIRIAECRFWRPQSGGVDLFSANDEGVFHLDDGKVTPMNLELTDPSTLE